MTGGSGFIGTHLVNGLIEQGCTVGNIDIKPPLLADHIPMWRKVHILNIDDLKSVVQKEAPEAVIHLAARAEILSKDWSKFASIHEGTCNLIDAVSGSQSIKRLINVN